MSYDIKGSVNVEKRLSAGLAVNIPNWQANKVYLTNDKFMQAGKEYLVIADHTSLAVFDPAIVELAQSVGTTTDSLILVGEVNSPTTDIVVPGNPNIQVLLNGKTWNDLNADTDFFEYRFDATPFDNGKPTPTSTNFVKRGDITFGMHFWNTGDAGNSWKVDPDIGAMSSGFMRMNSSHVNWTGMVIRVYGIKMQKTVVDPNTVVPTPLAYGEDRLSANLDLTNTFQPVNSLTLPNIGKYEITATFKSFASGDNPVSEGRFFHNGLLVEQFYIQYEYDSASNETARSTTTVTWIIDTVAVNEVCHTEAQEVNIQTLQVGTRLVYKQLPTHSVVLDQTTLVPESLDSMLRVQNGGTYAAGAPVAFTVPISDTANGNITYDSGTKKFTLKGGHSYSIKGRLNRSGNTAGVQITQYNIRDASGAIGVPGYVTPSPYTLGYVQTGDATHIMTPSVDTEIWLAPAVLMEVYIGCYMEIQQLPTHTSVISSTDVVVDTANLIAGDQLEWDGTKVVKSAEWPDLGWFTPIHQAGTSTGALTVADSDDVTAIEYDQEDAATGAITHKVWDATTFTYTANTFYGAGAGVNDTYTISENGFFYIFVKRSPTELHVLVNKSGFQRIRSVNINGKPASTVDGPVHVQQAIANIPDPAAVVADKGYGEVFLTGNITVTGIGTALPGVWSPVTGNNITQTLPQNGQLAQLTLEADLVYQLTFDCYLSNITEATDLVWFKLQNFTTGQKFGPVSSNSYSNSVSQGPSRSIVTLYKPLQQSIVGVYVDQKTGDMSLRGDTTDLYGFCRFSAREI